MCYDCNSARYGHGVNYVCFTCRKFHNTNANICSRCNKSLQQVTPRFRAPKYTDKKAWKRSETIFKNVHFILGQTKMP